jgi:guanylate kinase
MKKRIQKTLESQAAPLLIVVSAPSGAGKSTLCNLLMEHDSAIVYSISCTTRAPRGGEQPGVQYHFLSAAEFARRRASGEFLEHAQVHGYQYGTLKQTVYDILATGHDILMDIDVQGAAQIRAVCAALPDEDPIKKGYVDIFITPPSLDTLRERLEKRSTDKPEVIEARLRNAQDEMNQQSLYQHVIVNDKLDHATEKIIAALARERKKRA